jgi:hypothetical protein
MAAKQPFRLRTAAEMKQIRADNVKESSIENYFIKQAKVYGCLQRKLTQYYAEDGWPDRMLVWPVGVTDYCELKRPKGGKVEPRQKTIHKELLDRSCMVVTLSTKDLVDEYFSSRSRELRVPKGKPPPRRARAALLSADEFLAGE